MKESLSKPLIPSVFMQGFVWGLAYQSLSRESELNLSNDSLKMPWLWGCWTQGMSKWITPCNTWHQLFCLPGYCCWHKVMPTAHDPQWHRMMSWDMQTFWSSSPERVDGAGEQRCLSGTSPQWQFVLSMEQFDGPIPQKWTKLFPWVKVFFPHFSGSLGKISGVDVISVCKT